LIAHRTVFRVALIDPLALSWTAASFAAEPLALILVNMLRDRGRSPILKTWVTVVRW